MAGTTETGTLRWTVRSHLRAPWAGTGLESLCGSRPETFQLLPESSSCFERLPFTSTLGPARSMQSMPSCSNGL